MRIPENEIGLPLVEAVQKVTGRRPHLSTCIRWAQRPNRHGVRLETWLIGGRRVTSPERVRAYFEKTTAAADGVVATPATSTQLSRAHAAAKAELAKEFGG